ncbi:hypothetical protein [Xanthomonas euvesicatoria]|uniref:hypothetical protein n=1 Tax=Xanthomonas euvesicatoria TaxID=456327 RepID=UPI0030C7A4DE
MARYSPRETTQWVAGNLREARDVVEVDVVSDQTLRITRRKYAPFVAGVVSVIRVEADTVRAVVSQPDVEIVANVPKESFWTGDALRVASTRGIATGSYGDLLRVIGLEDVRSFVPKDIAFIERGLRQHDRIAGFERVHDRIYRIRRNGMPELVVAVLTEYELTGDHLRTARDRYGAFDLAVITDPNGRATGTAKEVAGRLGAEVLNWAGFYGRLNRP